MIEEWREIRGCPDYKVSSLGNVKSFKTRAKGRLLKANKGVDRYLKVSLLNKAGRKTYRVHRLVCEAFHPNPDDLPEVNHWDEDRSNNYATNLVWCTAQENSQHSNAKHYTFMKDEELIKIFNLDKFCRVSGLDKSHMNKVHQGDRVSHKGYSRA